MHVHPSPTSDQLNSELGHLSHAHVRRFPLFEKVLPPRRDNDNDDVGGVAMDTEGNIEGNIDGALERRHDFL